MARKADPDARRKLLDAAREAFAVHGVAGARIEDIAHAAGLSKGSFYLHFDSKEAAFDELVSGLFAVMQDIQVQRHDACNELAASIGVLTAEDRATDSPRRRAWAEVEHLWSVRTLEALWRHRDVVRAVLYHAPDVLDRFGELIHQLVAGQLQAAAELGGLRADLDLPLVSDLILGAWLQLSRRLLRSPRKPDFDAWARTIDVFTSEGIATRSVRIVDHPVTRETA